MGKQDVACVFVHGLFGSSKTWACLLDHLEKAPYFQEHAKPFVFEYESPKRTCFFLRRIPHLGTIASKLRTFLHTEHVDHYKHVVLIGHSLGGLVIQKMLVEYREDLTTELRHLRRVILIAVPNNGSEFLLSLRWLTSTVLRHPHEALTRPLNHEIEELQASMARSYAARVNGEGKDNLAFDVFVGENDKVVTVGSARGVFREINILPGDHRSILNPRGGDTALCVAVLESIRQCCEFLPSRSIHISVRSLDPKVAGTDVARIVRQLFPLHAHIEPEELSRGKDYYASQGEYQVNLVGAFLNNELCGFTLFTETPTAIIVGYIGVLKGHSVKGYLRQALFLSLVESIELRATDLGRPVLFEVKRPASGSSSFKGDQARVRLFLRQGARIISGIKYKAPDMSRLGEAGAEEAYLLMYGKDGAFPEMLRREEVRRLVSHFYEIAYLHWFAPKLGKDYVQNYLAQLTEQVMDGVPADVPLNRQW